MGDELGRAVTKTPAGTFYNADSTLEHEFFRLSDAAGMPLLYYADITTPVCIDNLCKPMHIAIYWNLVGAYVGYGVFAKDPLTKYDHDEFLSADHEQLHRLLLDANSVLKRQALSDLFEETAAPAERVTYKGEEVDAVSGATRKEIAESVVEGALYSCYTIWHLVHSPVSEQIQGYTAASYNDALERQFLYAPYADYRLFAMKQLEASDFRGHLPQLLTIFETGTPLLRTYLLKKLPVDLWAEPEVTASLYGAFSTVDINSRTLLLDHLPDADPQALVLLAEQVTAMSKNQLRSYLQHLEKREEVDAAIRTQLEAAAGDVAYPHAYLIGRFLGQ